MKEQSVKILDGFMEVAKFILLNAATIALIAIGIIIMFVIVVFDGVVLSLIRAAKDGEAISESCLNTWTEDFGYIKEFFTSYDED